MGEVRILSRTAVIDAVLRRLVQHEYRILDSEDIAKECGCLASTAKGLIQELVDGEFIVRQETVIKLDRGREVVYRLPNPSDEKPSPRSAIAVKLKDTELFNKDKVLRMIIRRGGKKKIVEILVKEAVEETGLTRLGLQSALGHLRTKGIIASKYRGPKDISGRYLRVTCAKTLFNRV